jgi:hypothetical protein
MTSILRELRHGCPAQAWLSAIWPSNNDPLFALSCSDFCSEMDEALRAVSHPIPEGLTLLLDSDIPFTFIAQHALGLALNAADKADGQMAVDALITLISDGRFDPAEFSVVLSEIFLAGYLVPGRIVPRLREASETNFYAKYCVLVTLEGALRIGGKGRSVKNVHTYLELLHDLYFETHEAPEDQDFITLLKSLKGSSKAAKLAKILLALKRNPQISNLKRKLAIVQTLQSRIERAERWSRQ